MDQGEQLLKKHLLGARLVWIEKREFDWLFQFDTECSIAIESLWRVVSQNAIEITSEDHGHQFGLSAPLDAFVVTWGKIGHDIVSRIYIDAATSDLTLDFYDGRTLQFINSSAGYETWHFVAGSTSVIGRNGERVVISSGEPD